LFPWPPICIQIRGPGNEIVGEELGGTSINANKVQ
jgi:hypothetical protein